MGPPPGLKGHRPPLAIYMAGHGTPFTTFLSFGPENRPGLKGFLNDMTARLQMQNAKETTLIQPRTSYAMQSSALLLISIASSVYLSGFPLLFTYFAHPISNHIIIETGEDTMVSDFAPSLSGRIGLRSRAPRYQFPLLPSGTSPRAARAFLCTRPREILVLQRLFLYRYEVPYHLTCSPYTGFSQTGILILESHLPLERWERENPDENSPSRIRGA